VRVHGDAQAALLASPQMASICSCDIVGPPPVRMLWDAKTLITSAPSSAALSTCARNASAGSFSSDRGSMAVRMRGPGRSPRAIASRSGLSTGAPRDCTVVMPPISVTYAFSAA
jgi:hypothetical protein